MIDGVSERMAAKLVNFFLKIEERTVVREGLAVNNVVVTENIC